MDRVAHGQRLGRRDVQEDAVRVLAEDGSDPSSELLLLLADGMGGHAGGEVASRTAVDAFAEHFRNVSENMRPRGRLSEAMDAANAAIGARIGQEPDLKGMGSTFIGALIAQNRLVWASVGDSILFLLRGGTLRRLNADHSLFGELMEMVERGELTREEAENHPKRNALLSALTGEPFERLDLNAIPLEPGDVVLLASDGLETLDRSEISRIAQARAGAGGQAIVSGLLDAVDARDRPKQDNTSLIAVRQAGTPAAPSAHPPDGPGEAVPPRNPLRMLAVAGGVAILGLLGVLLLRAPDDAAVAEADAPVLPLPLPTAGPASGGITEETVRPEGDGEDVPGPGDPPVAEPPLDPEDDAGGDPPGEPSADPQPDTAIEGSGPGDPGETEADAPGAGDGLDAAEDGTDSDRGAEDP